MKTRLIGFFIFLAVLLAMVIAVNGASIPGTIVAAAITTGDTANDFATAFTFEIQGTMKQVPDLTARDAISADRRTEGMFCYVTGETNLYVLEGGTNNANWALWSSPTNSLTLVTVNNFVETNIFSSFTATNIYTTNLFASNIVTVYLVASNAYFTNVWIEQLTSITNFLDTVYITNKLELEYLTPNTVLQADASRDIQSIPNASGALTNNGTGTVGYYNSFASQIGNNTWTASSSNFLNNAVWTYATNANNTTPDFAVLCSTLATNNNFTWLLPTHLDASGKAEQWIKTAVTNQAGSGSPILQAFPGGIAVNGSASLYVTNWAEQLWEFQPPSGPTNVYPLPGH